MVNWTDLDRCFAINPGLYALGEVPPVQYALEQCESFIQDGEVFIPALDPVLRGLQKRFHTMNLQVAGEPDSFYGFRIDDMDSKDWAAAYQSSSRSARFLRHMFAAQLWRNAEMPDGFRFFCMNLAKGEIPEPEPSKTKATVEHRDTLIALIANRAHHQFGVDVAMSRASLEKPVLKVCGATIAAAALHAYGLEVNPTNAVKIASKHRKILGNFPSSAWTVPSSGGILMAAMGRNPIAKGRLEKLMMRARQYFDRWAI